MLKKKSAVAENPRSCQKVANLDQLVAKPM